MAVKSYGKPAKLIPDRAGGTSSQCANPPAKTIDDLVDLIQGKGIDCSNGDAVRLLLSRVGYQHFASYIPIVVSAPRKSPPDIKELHDILLFDRNISAIIFKYIGVVELQFKTQYSHLMSTEYGAFPLYDETLFLRTENYSGSLDSMKEEINRQIGKGNRFIDRTARANNGRLPIWIAVEYLTLGTLSKFYANTANTAVTTSLAASFYMSKERFSSWLKTVTDVRNVCAHFGPYVARKQIPSPPKRSELIDMDNTSPFYIVPMLEEMLTYGGRTFGDWNLDYAYTLRSEIAEQVADYGDLYPDALERMRIPAKYKKACP